MEFVLQKVPMLLMVSCLGAVEIGQLRQRPNTEHRGPSSKNYMTRGADNEELLLKTRVVPKGVDIELGTAATLNNVVFTHMRGHASQKPLSDHSSDITLSMGGRASPNQLWDFETRTFFPSVGSSVASEDSSTTNTPRS